MDGGGLFIDLRYGGNGGSNCFKGFVGAAHDGIAFLWVVVNGGEVGLAGAVFSEELKDGGPNGVHDILLLDSLFTFDLKNEITSS